MIHLLSISDAHPKHARLWHVLRISSLRILFRVTVNEFEVAPGKIVEVIGVFRRRNIVSMQTMLGAVVGRIYLSMW